QQPFTKVVSKNQKKKNKSMQGRDVGVTLSTQNRFAALDDNEVNHDWVLNVKQVGEYGPPPEKKLTFEEASARYNAHESRFREAENACVAAQARLDECVANSGVRDFMLAHEEAVAELKKLTVWLNDLMAHAEVAQKEVKVAKEKEKRTAAEQKAAQLAHRAEKDPLTTQLYALKERLHPLRIEREASLAKVSLMRTDREREAAKKKQREGDGLGAIKPPAAYHPEKRTLMVMPGQIPKRPGSSAVPDEQQTAAQQQIEMRPIVPSGLDPIMHRLQQLRTLHPGADIVEVAKMISGQESNAAQRESSSDESSSVGSARSGGRGRRGSRG
ncbi:unnamed protein product, partial [Scytosiphon promiscuus]